MNKKTMLYGSLFLTVYIAMSAYVGVRLWGLLGASLSQYSTWAYGLLFGACSGSYIAGRVGQLWLPGKLSNVLLVLGLYWMAVSYYLLLFTIIFDFVNLVGSKLSMFPEVAYQYHTLLAIGMLLVAACLVLLGRRQAHKLKITRYTLQINKSAGKLNTLRLVVASDIHMGPIVDKARVEKLMNVVQDLNPDIVLFPGDIVDENVGYAANTGMFALLGSIKPKYGVYGVLGSHEYIWGKPDKAISQLENSGVKILRDNVVCIEDSFYLVGRDDHNSHLFTNKNRKPLSDILTGIDRSIPILLMDHHPRDLEQAAQNGVDLQVSGHTHAGQIFPTSILNNMMYELAYGYKRKEHTHFIVTSGVGTWMLPIRLGTTPEVVEITIQFLKAVPGQSGTSIYF